MDAGFAGYGNGRRNPVTGRPAHMQRFGHGAEIGANSRSHAGRDSDGVSDLGFSEAEQFGRGHSGAQGTNRSAG